MKASVGMPELNRLLYTVILSEPVRHSFSEGGVKRSRRISVEPPKDVYSE